MVVRRKRALLRGESVAVSGLGLVLPTFPQQGLPSIDVGSIAAAAERSGAAAVWACDHLFWFGPNLECMTAVALAAAATEDCAVGTAVVQLPLRSAPAVAKAAGSLQLVSGGRFVLGVGAGSHAEEYRVAGVPFTERGARLDGAIDLLRGHWAESESAYAQRPAPAPIPIWVGGSSDAARRRAAARGDGWMPMFLSPEQLTAAYRKLDEETAEAGRSPGDVVRAALVFVSVGSEPEATERGAAWLSSLYRIAPERFARHLIAGDPARCAETLRAYRNAGAEHVALFIADDDPLPQFTALAGLLQEVGA